jgi:cellulose biosynthesis protein BcsQ
MPEQLFDDSLEILVRTLRAQLGNEFVESGTALRDASGRLSFFSSRAAASDAERHDLAKSLSDALGPYARRERPIVFADEGGAAAILSSPNRLPIRIESEGVFCQLLDRRIVGTGWLEVPVSLTAAPPRVVFATLKGGVGRSTALVVAAADLARRNRNVLVIDLDLEAPGLGDMMLSEDRVPELGVVDFLVENGLRTINDGMLPAFIGTSFLTDAGGGRVDVMPAIGKRSTAHPENVLAKLSRAMIEDVTSLGSISVGEQISSMINRIAQKGSYDVVLIDSRAGLSELAAPAVIGLGATVLLFGTAQKQTVEGYRSLFAALQLLAQRDRALGRDAEWRTLLRPVYAKASMDTAMGLQFQEDFYELYSAHLYDAEESGSNSEGLRFPKGDDSAPHWPLTVAFSQSFLDFDPTRKPGQLTSAFYEEAFRPFLNELDKLIAAHSMDGQAGEPIDD